MLAAAGVPFSEALENWVSRLSDFAADGLDVPTVDKLDTGGSVTLEPGHPVAFEGPASRWVRVDEGGVRLLGLPELSVPALPVYLPLGASMWLDATSSARLTVRTAGDIDENGELVRGLSLFHALLQKRLRLLESAEQAAEVARLEARHSLQQRLLDGALNDMAAVINPSQHSITRDSALLGAAAMVGEALDLEIRPPLGSENMKRVRDPLEAIARAAKGGMRDAQSILDQSITHGGGEVTVAGVEAVRAPGHNEDMCIVRLDGGAPEAQAVFLADLVPTPAHVPTAWIASFDLLPVVTMETKQVWLRRAFEERWLCIFQHETDAPLGRLDEPRPDRLQAVPA